MQNIVEFHIIGRTCRIDAAKKVTHVSVAAGSFKTLVGAVTATGLGDTLNGDGPFTVFAPSDDAFAKLPAGTVDELV